jgi:hypothetical protein
MTAPLATSNRKPDQHSTAQETGAAWKSLNRLAANPWALSCTSFMLTAVLIRADCLSVF